MARIVQEGKAWARFKDALTGWQARRKGLLANSGDALPPASEREARMDDPTSRCENDAGLGARLLELLISIRSSFFLCGTELVPAKRID